MRKRKEGSMSEANVRQDHEIAFLNAQSHARKCRSCAMPIVADEEGNPGFYSEACPTGAVLLRTWQSLEGALLRQMENES